MLRGASPGHHTRRGCRLGGPLADADDLEAQLRRLAAIVAPLAETVNQHDARMAVLEAIVVRLDATVARLDRLIAEVFRERHNGREA